MVSYNQDKHQDTVSVLQRTTRTSRKGHDSCIYKYSPQMQSSESGQCDWKFSYVPKRFAGEASVEWNSGHSSRVQHHKLMTCKMFWEDVTTGEHTPKFKWRKLAYRIKSFDLFSTAWVNRPHDNICGVDDIFCSSTTVELFQQNISVGSPIHIEYQTPVGSKNRADL